MEQERKTMTATALATDQGEFEAIAAAWSIDREHDQIKRGAFARSIQQWRRSGKQIPLHWDHQGDPASIIGHIDPASMRETSEGLLVKGQIDLEGSEVGREAWRLVKQGLVGLSFGYLATGAVKRADGGRDLTEIDLFEISITPAPMNADTRILSAKSLEEQDEEREKHSDQIEELRGQVEFLLAQVGVKAVWTTAYVNDLPDSSFLYIEPGGSKDDTGKTTPRSLRHFPVKDAGGSVDMPHLRNALARIPQSNLSQAVKDRCTEMAQRMLDAEKSVPEPGRKGPVDPVRRRSEQVVLEIQSDGASLRKSPPPQVQETPDAQAPPEDQLRRQSRDLMLEILTNTG